MEAKLSLFRFKNIYAVPLLLLLSCYHALSFAADMACKLSPSTIYDNVSPAVVAITATAINPYQVSGRIERREGSGILFRKDGYVLTNSHIVFGTHSLAVTLTDERTFPAVNVGIDPLFDIAVLQILDTAPLDLPVAPFGNSDGVKVGESVVAIGNPLGLQGTLTDGIISGINRIIPLVPFPLSEPFIQIDTPINPGSSGGPLVNRCGEVIGINTAMVAGAENIGFAIPINLAKTVSQSLIADGRVIRPWFGFYGQLIDDNFAQLFKLPLATGLLVELVEAGGPAEQAGIRGGQIDLVVEGSEFLLGGDVITHINGIALRNTDDLIKALTPLKVGMKLNLKLLQNGQERSIEYVLPERPLQPGDVPEQLMLWPTSNLSLQNLKNSSYRAFKKLNSNNTKVFNSVEKQASEQQKNLK